MDLDTGEIITLGDGELTIAENNITFEAEKLRVNRHYNVTIRASHRNGSIISSFVKLSKVNVTSTQHT